MIKIIRSHGRLIFIMGIPIMRRRHIYIETGPCVDTLVSLLLSRSSSQSNTAPWVGQWLICQHSLLRTSRTPKIANISHVELQWALGPKWYQPATNIETTRFSLLVTRVMCFINDSIVNCESCIHLRPIARDMLKISIIDMRLKNIDLKLQSHLPGTDELNY